MHFFIRAPKDILIYIISRAIEKVKTDCNLINYRMESEAGT